MRPEMVRQYPYSGYFVVQYSKQKYVSEKFLISFSRYDQDNGVTYGSTEFIHRVGESVPGPDLPNPLRSHVAVQLSETVTIIIGK